MKFTKKFASAAAIGAIAALAFGGTAAQAAEGDPITLTPQITLGAGSFTVAGANCVNPDGSAGEVATALATDDPENPVVRTAIAEADGTWSIVVDAPAESGVYEVAAYCNLYADQFGYASTNLLVSAAAGVQLSVSEAQHFETFDFSGAGFTPNESVRVEFRQSGKLMDSLGTLSASEVGEILGEITLGNILALGTYDVVFIGEESGVELSAQLNVTDGSTGGSDDNSGSDTDNSIGNGDSSGNVADNGTATPVETVSIHTGAKLATTGGENFAPLAILGGIAALAIGAGAVVVGRRKALTAE